MKQAQKVRIVTEEENERYLKMIEDLMNKGSDNLTEDENELLIEMTRAVQAFEQTYYDIPKINSLEAMLELKMYELKLNRTRLSALLGIANSKLSEIMNGKRAPDVKFLKAAHSKLGIDAGFLLNHA
jgi:antitoxin component HigA of HigAB toxin-antitoxin module